MNATPRRRGKVCVVDDEPQVLELIRAVLAEADYASDGYAGGREALEAIDEEVHRRGPTGWCPWDVLLFDVSLQDMDGFALLEAVRSRKGFATVPVLFMSGARLSDDDVERGLALGALDYLAKPFSVTMLVAKVHNFAELGRFRRRAHQTALALEESEAWHRELFDGSSQGILVYDDRFRIIRCNAAAARSSAGTWRFLGAAARRKPKPGQKRGGWPPPFSRTPTGSWIVPAASCGRCPAN